MDISLQLDEKSPYLTPFKIIKKLGKSNFNVYHVSSSSKNMEYALKTFPKDEEGEKCFNREKLMFKLSHPNIIKYILATPSEESRFYTVLTEFAPYGDLYSLAVGDKLKSEILLRTYFHQLIAGVEYLHSQGVAHLDLKLENLMIGADFNLKIIDFDHAQPITEKILDSAGTRDLRAPEVINKACNNLAAVDIFSIGVILFVLKTKEYPFKEKPTSDGKIILRNYSTFVKRNKTFWKRKAENKPETFFSEEFIELINGMLEYEVEKRFTFSDIKKSKWYNGPILTEKNLHGVMESILKEEDNNKSEPSAPLEVIEDMFKSTHLFYCYCYVKTLLKFE